MDLEIIFHYFLGFLYDRYNNIKKETIEIL
jgi:hypothetical protein